MINPIRGEIIFPGDKSISHRALMFASLAKGNSLIYNISSGEDVLSTRNCLESCGVIIRDNQMINYVASPTKISEYAACDLKLATSTGQFSSLSGFTRGRYMSLNEIINSHKNIYFNLCCS